MQKTLARTGDRNDGRKSVSQKKMARNFNDNDDMSL